MSSSSVFKKAAKNRPKVSVIINVYNGEKYIDDTVDSILRQSYQNFELIIFDNCSTDGTMDILKRIDDDRLQFHSSASLVPLYSARNMAVEKTRGEFIAFCDADDLWLPTKLEEQLAELEKTKNMVICTNFLLLNERGGGGEYSWVHDKLPEQSNHNLIINNPYIHMSSLLVDTRIFTEYGVYFNPELTILGDMDFFVRCYEFSDISVIDNFLTIYRYHNENTGLLRFKEFYTEGIPLVAQYRNSKSVSESVLLKFEKRLSWMHFRQNIADGEKVELCRALKELDLFPFLTICILIIMPTSLIKKIGTLRGNI